MTVYIIVTPEGSLTIDNSNQTANDGDTVTFTCTTSTGPKNKFTWYKNNTAITNSSDLIITNTNRVSTLIISSVVGNHGTYKCEVSNSAGEGSVNATLIGTVIIILYSYIDIHCTVSPFGLVTTVPTNITVKRGDDTILTCNTDGGFGNIYVWLKNGADAAVCSNCTVMLDINGTVYND